MFPPQEWFTCMFPPWTTGMVHTYASTTDHGDGSHVCFHHGPRGWFARMHPPRTTGIVHTYTSTTDHEDGSHVCIQHGPRGWFTRKHPPWTTGMVHMYASIDSKSNKHETMLVYQRDELDWILYVPCRNVFAFCSYRETTIRRASLSATRDSRTNCLPLMKPQLSARRVWSTTRPSCSSSGRRMS